MKHVILTVTTFASLAVLAFIAQCNEPQPKITVEQQAEWLQARAELAEAKLAVTTAEAKISAIVAKMLGTCALVLTDGRPQCIPPNPKQPETKK